jgi:hypothetical protein
MLWSVVTLVEKFDHTHAAEAASLVVVVVVVVVVDSSNGGTVEVATELSVRTGFGSVVEVVVVAVETMAVVAPVVEDVVVVEEEFGRALVEVTDVELDSFDAVAPWCGEPSTARAL